MGISKRRMIEDFGGLPVDPERVNEIRRLEDKFRSGKCGSDELETIERRLCQLKGLNFDDYDLEDHPNA